MTKMELAAAVAKDLGIRKEIVTDVVNCMFEHMKMALRVKDRIVIREFGTFSVQHYNPHRLKSARTGEWMSTSESDKVVFKQASNFDVNSLI